jgi:hypothetical protein
MRDQVNEQINWNKRVDTFVINLAYEGVPQSAIARALHLPLDEVEEIVADAVTRGIIVTASARDWPAGSRFARHPFFSGPPIDDDTLVLATVKIFGLTRMQAALFLTLVRRKLCTREILHDVVESRRVMEPEPTNQKIIDVAICNLRKKLNGAYTIETVWRCGFTMPDDDRRRAAEIILNYFEVAADAAARKKVVGETETEAEPAPLPPFAVRSTLSRMGRRAVAVSSKARGSGRSR